VVNDHEDDRLAAHTRKGLDEVQADVRPHHQWHRER
jgi:hypothetical protein